MKKRNKKEGLKIFRLLMVLSSIAPLFIIWGIRGNALIPDIYFIPFCIIMVVVPYTFLGLRIRTARKQKDKRELVAGRIEDSRYHLLVYLFAMLLPLFTIELNTWRNFSAIMVALVFIIFLFWHLNLHYMNIVFAIFGYHVFTVYPPKDDNPLSGKNNFVLITFKDSISEDDKITAYRISNSVYLEVKK